MSESKTETQDVKSGWDQAYAEHSGGTLWRDEPIQCLPKALDAIRSAGCAQVVDLGCGDGRNLAALAKADLECAGVDLSQIALSRAAQRLKSIERRAFLLKGDIAVLPFSDASVDAVTCFDVFGQLSDPEAVIAEVARILVPGGIFALNAYTPNDSEFGQGDKIGERVFMYKSTLFRFFEEQEIRDMFAGWNILDVEKQSWTDPPHGEFRPYEHTHENWIVIARKSQ